MTSTDVLVAGPASWNRIVHVDALPDPTPHTVFARDSYDTIGGTSAGKALNLAALGRTVALRTVLGADDEGRRVRDAMAGAAGAGVRLIAEPSADGRSESHLNLMAPGGGRLSVYLRAPGDVPAAGPLWDETLAALDAARAVVVDLAAHSLPVLAAAAARGRDVWVDLHDYDGVADFHRPWVDAGTHVFLSSDRLPGWRDFLRARVDAGARLAVCTHGAAGATALTPDGGFVEVDAVPVADVVDTNGAGDGFFAGVLDAHLRGAALTEALRAGAMHAARVVRTPGLAPAG
ncbi:hypothetical protein GCM10009809_14430 [Isoptericola hypogeus]|uniref:Carbohydrate kinase PfkB domain-containing protein n=1 Tax=Isoptericola hypogeus TaxID=300179 RepID=A0ABN2J7Z4_9MICO